MAGAPVGRRSLAAAVVVALLAPGSAAAQEPPVPRWLVGGAVSWTTFTGSRFSVLRGAVGLDASVAVRVRPRLQLATIAHVSRHPTEVRSHAGLVALSVEPRLVFPRWRSRPLTYVGARASAMYRLGDPSGPGWGVGAALGALWGLPGRTLLETGVTLDLFRLPGSQSGHDAGRAISAHVGLHVPVGAR